MRLDIGICGILFFAFTYSSRIKFQPGFTVCNAGNTTCIKHTIDWIMATQYTGNAALNLPQFDPIQIPHAKWHPHPSSLLQMKLVLTNVSVEGYRDFKATKIIGFGSNSTGQHEIQLLTPELRVSGSYSALGNANGITVNGEDTFWMTLSQVWVLIRINGQGVKREGETYMNITSLRVDFDIVNADLQFPNLVKESPQKSAIVRNYISVNWKYIYQENYKATTLALENVYTPIISGVFSVTPYCSLVRI